MSETDFYFVLSGTVRRPATEVRMAESLTNCWKGRDKPQVQADFAVLIDTVITMTHMKSHKPGCVALHIISKN